MRWTDDFSDAEVSNRWRPYFNYWGPGVTTGAVEESGGTLQITTVAATAGDPRVALARLRNPVGDCDVTVRITAGTEAPATGWAQSAFLGVFKSFCLTTFPDIDVIGIYQQNGVAVFFYAEGRGDHALTYTMLGTASLPARFRLRRLGARIKLYLNDAEVLARDDYGNEPAIIALGGGNNTAEASSVSFADFSIEYDSPVGNYLWYILPGFLKAYPLEISASGDLALTPSGVVCLLQDVANILETPRGDLASHTEIGAGLRQFLGVSDADGGRSRLAAQIAASLKRPGLWPRVIPERSSVLVTALDDQHVEVAVSIVAQDGETVVPLNFVYRYGIDGFGTLYADPPSAPLTTVPLGPAGYLYPALGRDLLLDRDNPAASSDEVAALPQRFIVDAIGSELDQVRTALSEMRDDFFIASAEGAALDGLATARDLKRLPGEEQSGFRTRIFDELEVKGRDGTMPGLAELLGFLGFDSTVQEGFTIEGPSDCTNAYWAQLWLDMTAQDGTVSMSEEEFYRRVFRRKRAARRIVYKEIAGGVGYLNDGGYLRGAGTLDGTYPRGSGIHGGVNWDDSGVIPGTYSNEYFNDTGYLNDHDVFGGT